MIKAIETRYNGYNFRSRAEARWALFFDIIKLKYQYEPEGFDLNGIWYLPDFFIPELDLFIEVKGKMNGKDSKKTELLCKHLNKKVYVVGPEIPYSKNVDFVTPNYYSISMSEEIWDFYYNSAFHYMLYPYEENGIIGVGEDFPYMFCECPDCGRVGVEFDARSDRLKCKETTCPTHSPNADKAYNPSSKKIMNGFKIARSYRF